MAMDNETKIGMLAMLGTLLIMSFGIYMILKTKSVSVDLTYIDGKTETVIVDIPITNEKPHLYNNMSCISTVDGSRCGIVKITNIKEIK